MDVSLKTPLLLFIIQYHSHAEGFREIQEDRHLLVQFTSYCLWLSEAKADPRITVEVTPID